MKTKSLFQEETRQELIDRLNRLSPQSQPLWGKMNCDQMIAHLIESMRMSTGEIKVAPKPNPLKFEFIKNLIIYWFPFPKNAPTARELLKRKVENLPQECSLLSQLILQYRDLGNRQEWPDHPVFGKMNSRDWAVICYRHIDHHFRQFGI